MTGLRDNRSNAHQAPRALFTGASVLVIGLLLWARLILVTNHPKTAIADPPVEPASSARVDDADASDEPREPLEAPARRRDGR